MLRTRVTGQKRKYVLSGALEASEPWSWKLDLLGAKCPRDLTRSTRLVTKTQQQRSHTWHAKPALHWGVCLGPRYKPDIFFLTRRGVVFFIWFTLRSTTLEVVPSETHEDFLSVSDRAKGLQSRLMTQATRPHRLTAPPDHPHDTWQRPVTASSPECGRDGTPASTRDAAALVPASEPCYLPHIRMRASARRPR